MIARKAGIKAARIERPRVEFAGTLFPSLGGVNLSLVRAAEDKHDTEFTEGGTEDTKEPKPIEAEGQVEAGGGGGKRRSRSVSWRGSKETISAAWKNVRLEIEFLLVIKDLRRFLIVIMFD